MSDRIDDPRRPQETLDSSLDRSSENVLDTAWPTPVLDDPPSTEVPRIGDTMVEPAPPAGERAPEAPRDEQVSSDPEPPPSATGPGDGDDEPGVDEPEEARAEAEPDAAPAEPDDAAEDASAFVPEPRIVPAHEHAPGELTLPPGIPVLEGEPRGERRTVGIVVSRFNGDVTTKLLDSAVEELRARGVDDGSITVMPVPGAFELPIAAMALAKTRRFACIVALGCVIKGDTPHFDYVASESASGLQLAGIETGVPVAFGVLTLDRLDQAEARYAKGADAVRTALEMADVFANLRAAASR